jgi:hypothetical protein
VAELLINLIAAIVVLAFAITIGFGLGRLLEIPARRRRASAFDYVYIDDDGNARELTAAEREYVATALFPDGDADQFIKPRYESLTQDSRMRGYLRRGQLPQRFPVAPAPQ